MLQHEYKGWLLLIAVCLSTSIALGQAPQTGTFINVALPIDDSVTRGVVSTVKALTAGDESADTRRIVILHFRSSDGSTTGSQTQFEPALALARFLTGESATRIKTVAYLSGTVEGHAVLPVLACDQIIVRPQASLGSAGINESNSDPVVRLAYESIAERRRTVPLGAVRAMLLPSLELAKISQVDGGDLFLAGEELQEARAAGKVWKEEQLSAPGRLASFAGPQMRNYRWATHEVQDAEEIANVLGLKQLQDAESSENVQLQAVLADLSGPVNRRRMQRVTNSLQDAIDRRGVNQVLTMVDSAGGNLNEAVKMASLLAELPASGVRTASYIPSQAIGDATLIALASQRIYMAPQATLGGPGAESFRSSAVEELGDAIDRIATASGRSPAIFRGLVDAKLEVYRYLDSRSGRIAYFTTDELEQREDSQRWKRQERIDLSKGINAEQALTLGLINGLADDLPSVAQEIGLPGVPKKLDDRKIIQFVENLGRQTWLPPLLLFLGFAMFSVEMGAPGIGIPGFVSLVSLLLYFWIQVAGGTAEWLEIFLFVGGLVGLLIEVLVFPGFGIFGIGGLVMLISSLVLVSQTFVFPNNSYQYAQMTRSLIGVVAALGGIIGGGVALRLMLPQIPFFRHLIMLEDEDEKQIRAANETIVRFDHLLGQQGITTTPLVPSGKARFGDELVAVVSDGPMIDPHQAISVKAVYGNRIVVESIDS
ncbi:MAG: NfeD family protein [Pirellulaceae bacterium]